MKPFVHFCLALGLVTGLASAGCSESALESKGDASSLATDLAAGKTCDELWKAAGDRIAAIRVEADTSMPCQSAEDCMVLGTSTACHPTCYSYFSVAGAKAMATTIADLNAGICAQYVKQGCPVRPIPPCVPPFSPNACINGSCTFVP